VRDKAQRASRVLLDIEAGAPVLLIPESSKSNSLIVANLGKLKVKNRFLFAGMPGTFSLKNKVRTLLLSCSAWEFSSSSFYILELAAGSCTQLLCSAHAVLACWGLQGSGRLCWWSWPYWEVGPAGCAPACGNIKVFQLDLLLPCNKREWRYFWAESCWKMLENRNCFGFFCLSAFT